MEQAVQPVASLDSNMQAKTDEREKLFKTYSEKIVENPDLTRALVSFQANKETPYYRWYKFKEAFSSELVDYFLERFKPKKEENRRLLDPFAGAGTALTTAAKNGWEAVGIELLPVGTAIIKARLVADSASLRSFRYYLNKLDDWSLKECESGLSPFPHLRITEKAFPLETENVISAYNQFIGKIRNKKTRYLFWFAALSVLEEVSYTRKDGQYLRWDFRSGKNPNSKFHKGRIEEFKPSLMKKLRTMLEDIQRINGNHLSDRVQIVEGSCLAELARMRASTFNLVITSPPYCNRYDYTRTYALELAFMRFNEVEVKRLRQELLSATVENRTKREKLASYYRSINKENRFVKAVDSYNNQEALHEALGCLYRARDEGLLNNNNIPNMVENYFFEMNIAITELARLLAPNGRLVMVNDNVRYNGEEIPVDLILSDFAAKAGLEIENIWVLPKGKGNSSQQMGNHGRTELRKCVYVWQKAT